MPYFDKFISADNLIVHLNSIISTIPSHVQADYAGFLSVNSITVYELAIKEIFNDFASAKNVSFGNFVKKHFSSINGRITLGDLKGQHIKPFGDKYLNRFNRDFQRKQNTTLATQRLSIEACYSNLITCRHKYVHGGYSTLSLPEVITNYNLGKEVIHSLAVAMRR